jgi:Tol biopolymer transport system component
MRIRSTWSRWSLILTIWITAFVSAPQNLPAQYFGQNKVRYESLDFKVLETPHFDIYYYDEEADAAAQVGRMAERWYARLSKLLAHELTARQPIILYASPTAFRGTTAIAGDIGETTGGVTEGLRRRLVMPLAGSLRETDHVLGHELVHAFQFDIASRQTVEGGGLASALQLPLWFVEGMAEYLSLGPIDPPTAMWLRDALSRDTVPEIEKLDDPRYFPYRFGQAFWAFIGGNYGDDVIGSIFVRANRTGNVEAALSGVLGTSVQMLTEQWQEQVKDVYQPVLRATLPADETAHAVAGSLADNDVGSLNLAPVLSPDGRRMIFFSAKDLFSIDLFIADAETGAILRKVTETAADPHFDSLGFVNSAGTWNRDGSRVAFGAISGGRPEITIHNAESGKGEQRFKYPALGEILNLSWSPNDREIVFSGTTGGVTDLFLLDLTSGKTRQLTDDSFADLQPAWSPDGRQIAFTTDRFTSNENALSFGEHRLALIDPTSARIQLIPAFESGKHINPQWSPDGHSVFFVSDRDGISNIYRVALNDRTLTQVTNLQTGVTGISSLSPALSAAANGERLVFTVFGNGNYAIYRMDSKALDGATVSSALARLSAGGLPPADRKSSEVAALLRNDAGLVPPAQSFSRRPYRAKIGLDFVAPPQISVGLSNFGSFAGGGTALQFSDLLGHHTVTAVVQTTITSDGGNFFNNFGGLASYQNQKSRWNWGFTGGQSPFVTGGFARNVATVEGEPALVDQSIQVWQINREFVGTLSYPFNRAQRIEFAAGLRNISFAAKARTNAFSLTTGQLLLDESEDLDHPSPLRMATTGAALVYDTSIFAGTSPIAGQSYRLEYGFSAGSLKYSSALADYRRYVRLGRGLSLAGRLLHFGRYGADGEDSRLQDLFVGNPALVRGYNSGSFDISECGPQINQTGACPVFDQLVGSRLMVANAEARVPLLGALGVIPSRALPPVEGALFYDAGVAWNTTDGVNFLGGSRKPVTSYGASLRFNMLGFAIGQLSLVHPNDRPIKGWIWEFSFTPGF